MLQLHKQFVTTQNVTLFLHKAFIKGNIFFYAFSKIYSSEEKHYTETESESFHLLVYSPNAHKGHSQESRTPPRSPVSTRPKYLGHLLLLSQAH